MATQHFSDEEFKCPCCGLLVEGHVLLLQMALERIRKRTGDRPMKIESGCRCEDHNREVGGAPESTHLDGWAADIRCGFGRHRFELIKAAIEEGITRIGIGEDFVHLDIAEDKVRNIIWLYQKKN